jgi:hypothetical protein
MGAGRAVLVASACNVPATGAECPDPDLAFASAGRLHGHIAEDRDLFDMFEFQRAATDLLGAMITLYSAGALHNDHVSPDLTAATPL